MASLTLLPRKKFEIKLEDGTLIEGQFGTWALKRFCDRLGVKMSGMQAEIERFVQDSDLNVIFQLILSAVEQTFRERGGKGFNYEDVQAAAWIDEMGGMGSADFVSLFNHAWEEEKKSTTANQESHLSGQTSSALQPQPGS